MKPVRELQTTPDHFYLEKLGDCRATVDTLVSAVKELQVIFDKKPSGLLIDIDGHLINISKVESISKVYKESHFGGGIRHFFNIHFGDHQILISTNRSEINETVIDGRLSVGQVVSLHILATEALKNHHRDTRRP